MRKTISTIIIMIIAVLVTAPNVFGFASTYVPDILKEIRVDVLNVNEAPDEIHRKVIETIEDQTTVLSERYMTEAVKHDFAYSIVRIRAETILNATIDTERIINSLNGMDVYEVKTQEVKIQGFVVPKGGTAEYIIYLQNLKTEPVNYSIAVINGTEFLAKNSEGTYEVPPGTKSDAFPVVFTFRLPRRFNKSAANIFHYAIKEIDLSQGGGMIDLKLGQERKFRLIETFPDAKQQSLFGRIWQRYANAAMTVVVVLIGIACISVWKPWRKRKRPSKTQGIHEISVSN